jgi:SAM-dependent methyltransferase
MRIKQFKTFYIYFSYKYRELVNGKHFLRRLYWRFLRLFGQWGKSYSWNKQFEIGYWHPLRNKDLKLISIVERLVDEGKIISLGCGTDDIIYKLSPELYTSFLGIDISKIAISKAKDKAKKLGLEKCQFHVGDIIKWNGDKDVSLIIMEESLYYLNSSQQKNLLQCCLNSLNANGAILVTVHSRIKHKKTLNNCKAIGKIKEEIIRGEKAYLILNTFLPVFVGDFPIVV